MTPLLDPLMLRDFLAGLAREFKNLNRPEIAERLETANRCFQLPPTSQFLAQAITALQNAVETGLLAQHAQQLALTYIKAIQAQSFSLPA